MKNAGILSFVSIILVLTVVPLYAAHDVICYEMAEPRTATDYLEAEVSLNPTLGIANLEASAEDNIKVKFLAVEKDTKDTVYAESTVTDIGPYPDSIRVEFPSWEPEGFCDEEPLIKYQLRGVAVLPTDDDRGNDTVGNQVISLWSHDVGAVDLDNEEGCDPGYPYPAGTDFTFVAAVENFGYNPEQEVEVKIEVTDLDSNNVLLWENTQVIESLDWRGNPDGEPYTTEVAFPTYTTINRHSKMFEAFTLLADDCPDDDYESRSGGVREDNPLPESFGLEALAPLGSGEFRVKFRIRRRSMVALEVFDASGRWICSLANEVFSPGTHRASWNGEDAAGRKVPSGTYTLHMKAEGRSQTCKLVIR